MKKILNIKTLLLSLCALIIVSCGDDEVIFDSQTEIPNFTNTEVAQNAITVSEGNQAEFVVVQEDLIQGKIDNWEGIFVYNEPISGQIGLRVVGGTATEGVDYAFNNYNWSTGTGNYYFMTIQDFSPFLLQDGYIYTYDASTSVQNTISNFLNIINDGVTEGEETIEIELFPVALGYIIIDDTLTITITD